MADSRVKLSGGYGVSEAQLSIATQLTSMYTNYMMEIMLLKKLLTMKI